MNSPADTLATAAELRQTLNVLRTALRCLHTNLHAQGQEPEAQRPTEQQFQQCMSDAGNALALADATLSKAPAPTVALNEDFLIVFSVGMCGLCKLADEERVNRRFFDLCEAFVVAIDDDVSEQADLEEHAMTRRLLAVCNPILAVLGKQELQA